MKKSFDNDCLRKGKDLKKKGKVGNPKQDEIFLTRVTADGFYEGVWIS